ncbi:hypothetical protein ACFFGH_23070 [Lysobacter korlensis]|uniref:Uncharacterized protein n=1 Tax=Lysobacter korlensis TaxID=553636 RepID=A0ABV6RVV2_9GAMM
MDATTPPRGDDEPTRADPAGPPPLVEPTEEGGAAAAGATRAGDAAPVDGPDRRLDRGPEDPTAPDTAVEATLDREPAGSSADEPVVPTANADEVVTTSAAVADEPADDAEEHEASADEHPGGQPEPVPASAHLGSGRAASGMPDAAAEHAAPQREIVYVAAPQPPKRKGNRGMGALIALLAAVIFLVVYVLFILLLQPVFGTGLDTDFLRNPRFYIPVLLFAIAFILLALIVNRAGWWSFVLGSLFVGMITYFGTIGALLLLRATALTPETAVLAFRQLLVSPTAIAAGLVAREVALWAGAVISARGRRVTARNAEARAEFERDEAERKAEIERNGAVIRERVNVR